LLSSAPIAQVSGSTLIDVCSASAAIMAGAAGVFVFFARDTIFLH
jgi:hypothetical protein